MALSDIINATTTAAGQIAGANANIDGAISTLDAVRVSAQRIQQDMTLTTEYTGRQEEADALKAEAAAIEAKCEAALAALEE